MANMKVGISRRTFKFMDMKTFCLLFSAPALKIRQQCLEPIQKETHRRYKKCPASSDYDYQA